MTGLRWVHQSGKCIVEHSFKHDPNYAGEYSCLRVDLIFQRKLSYYIVTIYIPCCMLVIVSWVSFWLDANAIPARVALGVTTLLTMATQTTGINNSLPPVSYTKVSLPFFFFFTTIETGSPLSESHQQHRSDGINQWV